MQNVVRQAFTETTSSGTELNIDNTIEARMDLKLNGNTSQKITEGKNLFDKDNANIIYATFNSSSTTLLKATYSKIIYIPITGGKTYTIQKMENQGSDKFGACTTTEVPKIGVSINNIIMARSPITITADSNAKYLGIVYVQTNLTTTPEEEILASIQIEEGSTATSYEPYTGGIPAPNPNYPQEIHCVKGNNIVKVSNGSDETDYDINLGNIELNAIEDFKDYFKKEKNKWYKVENIGSYTFEGNENFSFTDVGTINQRFDIRTSALNIACLGNPQYKLFTHFRMKVNNDGIWGEYYMVSDWLVIKDNDNKMTSLEDFKSWLSANKPTIYYARTSSVNKEITDTTLITQLNEISQALSQKGTTIISQNNDDLPFNLDVIALTK